MNSCVRIPKNVLYCDIRVQVHGHIKYAEEVRPDPTLRALLEQIPVPKHVFTNADSKHAWICLENLGMDQGLFDHVRTRTYISDQTLFHGTPSDAGLKKDSHTRLSTGNILCIMYVSTPCNSSHRHIFCSNYFPSHTRPPGRPFREPNGARRGQGPCGFAAYRARAGDKCPLQAGSEGLPDSPGNGECVHSNASCVDRDLTLFFRPSSNILLIP